MSKPRENLPGEFWQIGKKTWIEEGGKRYEVYSDNGWKEVRLRDPDRPFAQGPKIAYIKGEWQLNQNGLKGGSPVHIRYLPSEDMPVVELSEKKQALLKLTGLKGKQALDMEFSLASMPEDLAENILSNTINFKDIYKKSNKDYKKIFQKMSRKEEKNFKKSIEEDFIKHIALSDTDNFLNASEQVKLKVMLQAWKVTREMAEVETDHDINLDNNKKIKIFDLTLHYLELWHGIKWFLFTDPYTNAKCMVISRADNIKNIEKLCNKFKQLRNDSVLAATELYVKDVMLLLKKNIIKPHQFEEKMNMMKDLNISSLLRDPDFFKLYLQEMTRLKSKHHISHVMMTEIRKIDLPYIVLNREKSGQHLSMTTSTEVNNFQQSLSQYREALTIEAQTKVSGHVRDKEHSQQTEAKKDRASGTSSGARYRCYEVTISDLAEMQMSYTNFPEEGRIKINQIMNDIQAGRVTTKRIKGHYYYDMPQLGSGGRGVWRAAFERNQDIWMLKGFIDYHNSKAKIWGE